MTHKVTHVQGLPDVKSGQNQEGLSENSHHRRGMEGNRSVKVAQSILRQWSAGWDTNETCTELQTSPKMRAMEGQWKSNASVAHIR